MSKISRYYLIIYRATQTVERQVKGLIVTKAELHMKIVSHPFNWHVQRTHDDFEAFRTHLMILYP